ncbi:MAG: hypothetical protein RL589_955 [Actinomycetota bacterium]|jgi:hypothetical protein
MRNKVIVTLALVSLFSSATAFNPAQAALTIISKQAEATTTTIDKKTITLTPPTSNSPGAWSVIIDNPAIATANGLTVTLLSVGSTVIRYVQAATADYNAVSDYSRLTVNPGIPTVGEFKDQTVNLSQNFVTITAPTSNSDGTWSYTSLNTEIATISGNTVALRDGGTVQIQATQAATRTWTSATKTMTLTINALAPTIGSFSDITLSIDSVAKVQLTMPKSNSTGAWTLTSSDPSVVGLEGFTIVALKTGTSTITAKQAPAGGYRSTTASMKVTITAVNPSVNLANFKEISTELDPGAVKVIPFTAPTSNSPGTWSFVSSDPAIATVSGLNLVANKPGTITLTATQAASGNYAASNPVSIKVRILGKQTIAAPTNITKLVGDPAVKIVYPTSLSTGTWSATSSAPTVVSVNNGNLQFDGAGKAIITLSQPATDTYTATSTSFEVLVIGTPPTLGAFNPLTVAATQKLTNPVMPQSNSAGKWIFSSSDPSVVSIVDNVITGVKMGSAIISAYQEPAGKYGQSQTVQTTITVTAAPAPPKPSPTPTPAAPVAQPKASAFAAKGAVKVYVSNAAGKQVIVKINGKTSKVGANKVTPGTKIVTVQVQGRLILNRSLTVK